MKKQTILTGLIISMLSGSCLAASFSGRVQTMAVDPNKNKVFIRVAGHSSTANYSVACATHGYFTYVFNLDTPAGKEVFSMLSSAINDGRTMVLDGTGLCSIHGDTQDLLYTRHTFAPVTISGQ